MNLVSLIDSPDEEDTTKLKNIMKAFNISLDHSSSNHTDLQDIQTIMKKGSIEDFAKCIENVLNYDLSSLTNYSRRKMLDPSFVALFQIGRFIIQFLLFWKTKLFEENVELRSQARELQKVHQDYLKKKLEVRDLRKQLGLRLQSNKPFVSECLRCNKIFVNDSYLYAHHKRRHGDEAFHSNRIKIPSHDELQSPNEQRFDKVPKYNHDFTRLTSSKIMKMKLVPQAACLETQEKYWKGKLKELCDSHGRTEEEMKSTLNELKIENAVLNKEITNITKSRKTKSVEIQTESYDSIVNPENFRSRTISPLCSSSDIMKADHKSLFLSASLSDFSVDSIRQSDSTPEPFTFRRWSWDSHSQYPSSMLKENDIVEQVNSFLARYSHKEKNREEKYSTLNDMRCREEDRKVIAKCFTSEDLVNKLVGIYEKQTSLPLKGNDSRVSESFHVVTQAPSASDIAAQDVIQKTSRTAVEMDESMKESNARQIDIHTETSSSYDGSVHYSSEKPKTKVFPFLRNIPSKLMKNYTKSRKKCVDAIEGKIMSRFSSKSRDPLDIEERSIGETCHQSDTFHEKETEKQLDLESFLGDSQRRTSPAITNPTSEPQLVSALRKSKSTGNLVKKVTFIEELPRKEKDFNDSDETFSKFVLPKTLHSAKISAVVDVKRSGFTVPVPAPRARKNILSATSIEASSFIPI